MNTARSKTLKGLVPLPPISYVLYRYLSYRRQFGGGTAHEFSPRFFLCQDLTSVSK